MTDPSANPLGAVGDDGGWDDDGGEAEVEMDVDGSDDQTGERTDRDRGAPDGSGVEPPTAAAAPAAPAAVDDDDDALAVAVAELISEHGHAAHVEGRSVLITDPVPGTPHLAALEALGYVAASAPVGAAAHGPNGVAAAVWLAPELYIARWTGPARWVSAFKFPNRARPDTYVRDDSGIPTHLAKGSWYGPVPDEVAEAFFSVGILLDEPPFPVPIPPPPPPRPEPAPTRASTRAPAAPREPRAPRAPRPKAPPAPRKVVPATRTCALCNLQKHPSQFVEGSDLCVDCR